MTFFFIAASFGFFCRVSDLVVNMWLIFIYIYIYIYIYNSDSYAILFDNIVS
jgi:hypothetical protein